MASLCRLEDWVQAMSRHVGLHLDRNGSLDQLGDKGQIEGGDSLAKVRSQVSLVAG